MVDKSDSKNLNEESVGEENLRKGKVKDNECASNKQPPTRNPSFALSPISSLGGKLEERLARPVREDRNSGAVVANKSCLPICLRCLSPTLGHKHKSRLCELCLAKLTHGITNEFSDCRLEHRKVALLSHAVEASLHFTSPHQDKHWTNLSSPTTLTESPSHRCSMIEDKEIIHTLQKFPGPFSLLRYGTNRDGLCPPPNIFPFGDTNYDEHTDEEGDENDGPNVSLP